MKKDTKTFRVVVLGGLTLASATVPAFSVGCGDDGDFPREGPDASDRGDAGFDASFPREGPPDSSFFDAGIDASADAETEAGTDAGDAGDDAGEDGG